MREISSSISATKLKEYSTTRLWRPTHECIYVIPEVLGQMEELNVILKKILPLRTASFRNDRLIFLGNFIGKKNNSKDLINLAIELQSSFKDKIFFIAGKEENQFLRAIENEKNYEVWLENGGRTILEPYTNDGSAPPHNRLIDILPKSHYDFLKSLPSVLELECYLFFYGSFDHRKKIEDNSYMGWIYDTTACAHTRACVYKNKLPQLPGDKIFVGCYNGNDKKPFIYQKYFMLGGTMPNRMVVMELNSMEIMSVRRGKGKFHKLKFQTIE